jgi:hypothetical protein
MKLNTLFKTYNPFNTVTFPTRIGITASTAIDAIFIITSKYDNYYTSPLSNELSDHEAQLLTIVLPPNYTNENYKTSYRKINKFTINDFFITTKS